MLYVILVLTTEKISIKYTKDQLNTHTKAVMEEMRDKIWYKTYRKQIAKRQN